MARDESKLKTMSQKHLKKMDLKIIAKEIKKLGRTLYVYMRKETTCWRLWIHRRAMLDIQIFR
jgi:hypothetical protein